MLLHPELHREFREYSIQVNELVKQALDASVLYHAAGVSIPEFSLAAFRQVVRDQVDREDAVLEFRKVLVQESGSSGSEVSSESGSSGEASGGELGVLYWKGEGTREHPYELDYMCADNL